MSRTLPTKFTRMNINYLVVGRVLTTGHFTDKIYYLPDSLFNRIAVKLDSIINSLLPYTIKLDCKLGLGVEGELIQKTSITYWLSLYYWWIRRQSEQISERII